MEVISLETGRVRRTGHVKSLKKLQHVPKYTRHAIVNINHSEPSRRQPHVERINQQLASDVLAVLLHGSKRRLALCLAADLLARARGRSERLGTAGQPACFRESVDQTQHDAREPEPERDLEVPLRALRSEGEEFYLLRLRVHSARIG
jgi:hypothetical protein